MKNRIRQERIVERISGSGTNFREKFQSQFQNEIAANKVKGNIEGCDFRKGGRMPARPQTYRKDFTAAASSSFTSKTVYSLVICSRSCTFLVSLSSFSSPPWFFAVVYALTSSPIPELSM